jgi:hypothetical protein
LSGPRHHDMARPGALSGAGRLYTDECTCECVEQTVARSRQEMVRQSVCWLSDGGPSVRVLAVRQVSIHSHEERESI